MKTPAHSPAHLLRLMLEVGEERERQVAKFPEFQSLPNGTGGGGRTTWMNIAKIRCDRAMREGTLTHADVFDEEQSEVLAATTDPEVRAELIQVMAVCAKWIADIDARMVMGQATTTGSNPAGVALPTTENQTGHSTAPEQSAVPAHTEGPFCVCFDCMAKTAAAHKAADAACGREWLCQCGACKQTRVLADIDAAFGRVKQAERALAAVQAIKGGGSLQAECGARPLREHGGEAHRCTLPAGHEGEHGCSGESGEWMVWGGG